MLTATTSITAAVKVQPRQRFFFLSITPRWFAVSTATTQLTIAVKIQSRRRFFFLSITPSWFAVPTATTQITAAVKAQLLQRFFFLSGERKKKSAEKRKKARCYGKCETPVHTRRKRSTLAGNCSRVGVSICLQRSGGFTHIAGRTALPLSCTVAPPRFRLPPRSDRQLSKRHSLSQGLAAMAASVVVLRGGNLCCFI